MAFILAHTSGDFMSGHGRTKNKKEAKRFSTRAEAVAYKGNKVVSEEDPDYKKWVVMEVKDSAIDKAIRVIDENTGPVKRSGVGIDLYYQGSGMYAVVDNRKRPPMILRTGSKAVMESEYKYLVGQVRLGKM